MIRILIPVYNEEKNIEDCIEGIHRILAKTPHRFYTVDDGSRDGGVKIIKKLSRDIPITIMSHEINKGVAEALKTGFIRMVKESKKGDVAVVVEGDNTSTPELLGDMIEEIRNGADIVVASRYAKGGVYKNFPLVRLILSKAINLFLRWVFGFEGVRDYTIFFRAYKIELLKKIGRDELFKTRFFTANCELLVKCMEFAPKIVEVPYVYDYGKKKGASGIKIASNIWQYLRLVCLYKL